MLLEVLCTTLVGQPVLGCLENVLRCVPCWSPLGSAEISRLSSETDFPGTMLRLLLSLLLGYSFTIRQPSWGHLAL